MDFHISRKARERYQFDASIYAFTGDAILIDFQAARQFVHHMNASRDLAAVPEEALSAGQINAFGLIHEILHYVLKLYRTQRNPSAFELALRELEARLGQQTLDAVIQEFTRQFPPLPVHNGEVDVHEFLNGSHEGRSNRELMLEELILLWVDNRNPACKPFSELIDEGYLENGAAYTALMQHAQDFFKTQPGFGPKNLDLLSLLRSPAIASPYSLAGQLEFIQNQWSEVLGSHFYRLLKSLDLIREESRASFSGPGPTLVPVYDVLRAQQGGSADELSGLAGEPEAFSADREWMPRLVLLARNVYVWLDQLSRKYQRNMSILSDIPDDELAELSARGITGLWLIGLWERSRASATIKRLCGNPEALASAYSLFDYHIADDLGGEPAYQNLRDRAWRHGIRLASDMVPNHMGIDSPWVVEHPDWFIQTDSSPFPAYAFSGQDLSSNPAVTVQIEDHYFSRSDASVVFRYDDHRDGRVRYIYHGNDGTSMPWNDTAQLNYLLPEVREAVIQTILSVARRFPIIRFDAAMTLAKRHFQRLWFPDPGTGGAIPSRSEFGMTREQFNQVFPQEFWREVVDRVAVEAPDTLLLAEAFWLMEGYFVRTLGMHRVYNSAFMNMLRNEENEKYRDLMQNTLEFEPEILKRYVNFMNNPDEETAVGQFGKGDKYFGTCLMLATLPGLPMLGHGQVEGYTEKYGMEYRKAYRDELPDEGLVAHHRRIIFPLLHQRDLFAEVDNFHLFDFIENGGAVNENVFAYTNRRDEKSALILYNNSYSQTNGTLKDSTPALTRLPHGGRELRRASLTEALGIQQSAGGFALYRDLVSGLEYISSLDQLEHEGFTIHLNAYEHHAFLDWRVVEDDERGSYRQLHQMLGSRGVPSIAEAKEKLILQLVTRPFQEIMNPGYLGHLTSLVRQDSLLDEQLAHTAHEADEKLTHLLEGIARLTGLDFSASQELSRRLQSRLVTWFSLPNLPQSWPGPETSPTRAYLNLMYGNKQVVVNRTPLAAAWFYLQDTGKLSPHGDPRVTTRAWIDEWRLGEITNGVFHEMGLEDDQPGRQTTALKALCSLPSADLASEDAAALINSWLVNEDARTFMGVNRFQDILWYHQESLLDLLWWKSTETILDCYPDGEEDFSRLMQTVLALTRLTQRIQSAVASSQYQVEKLTASLRDSG